MRWIIRVLSAVAVMVGLAFATLALIPSDRIAAVAAAEFSRLTGRDLRVEGAADPSIWPVLGVRTGRVTLGNAPWSDQGPMLSAEGLAIGVDLSDLLGGRLRITELALIRPDIRLERSADGQANWHFATASGGSGGTGAGMPLLIETARITDGTVSVTDHATGRQLRLTGVEAEAWMPDPTGEAELTLSAETGGQTVTVAAGFTGPASLFSGKVVPARLTASAGKARASFDGRAGLFPLAMEGQVDADLADLSAVAALAGMPPPDLPQGWGRDGVAITGALTITPDATAHLRGGTVVLDGRRITGDADLLSQGKRLRLVAQLATGDLAFATTAAPAGQTGWSDAPVDASALGLIDADIGFRAASLALGPLKLGAVNGQVALDRGRAELTLAEVAAYGGAMSGRITADGRNGLAVAAEAVLKGVALQPLLTDLAGLKNLRATGDLSLSLQGAGASTARILASLSGNGRLSLGPGTVDGLDLAGLLATLDPSRAEGGATAFDSLTAGFTVTQGEAVTDDLALRGPLVQADGQGRIGLAARDIDLRLQTRALTGADGTGGLGIPVLVAGPWAGVRIALDLEALAAEKLEKAARAAAEDQLGLQAGETVEDAAKRKLDQEIQRGIDKALDGLFGN